MKTTYKTGREYNGPQILEIEYTPFTGSPFDSDSCDLVRVRMNDASRGISYDLRVLRSDCTPERIGIETLHSYDKGYFWHAV